MEKIVLGILAMVILFFAIILERGHLNRRSLHNQKLLNLRTKESES
jgi:hypothetical protein